MAIPNLHTHGRIATPRDFCRLLVAYLFPISIFTVAAALTYGFNALFFVVLREVWSARKLEANLYDMLEGYATRAHWLGYSTTYGFSVFALCLGNVLFALMFVSFLRAILTPAGYVPAEPWRWPPQGDAARQCALREGWARQQTWLSEQEALAHRKAAQEQQSLQQEQQQLLWNVSALLDCARPPPLPLSAPSGAGPASPSPSFNPAPPVASAVVPQHSSSHSVASCDVSMRCTHSPCEDVATVNCKGCEDAVAANGAPRTAASLPTASVAAVAAETLSAPRCATLAAPTSDAGLMNAATVHEYEADGSLRFCAACDQYKPDGSHHCQACQRCVYDMDHHCRFLNNCVGRHNYKYFFLCIFYSTLCCTVNLGLFLVIYCGSAACARCSRQWWMVPAGMAAIGVCVAHLWLQHVLLLERGVSTLDRIAELASERFLANMAGGHPATRGRRGCVNNCVLKCRVCATTVAQVVKSQLHHLSQLVHLLRRHVLPPGLNRDSAADAQLKQAERSARRLALLFGRPRRLWEHLLPVAPRAEAWPPNEKADNRVHVAAA